MVKTKVQNFSLQPTASFPDGAPQREEYVNDAAFNKDCTIYGTEWRNQYVCCNDKCNNLDCPQHGKQ